MKFTKAFLMIGALAFAGSAFAASTTPATTATKPAATMTTKPMVKKPATTMAMDASSKKCSAEADAKGLHGKERVKFRAACKAAAKKMKM